MDFSDGEHRLAELVFQGAVEHHVADRCDATALAALEAWSTRDVQHQPNTSHFHVDGLQGFSITYDGVSSNHWPNADSNWLREALIREFLFPNGVCDLTGLSPRVFELRYKVQALTDTEHLLICPYATRAGNIGGVVVVCMDHHLSG